jgi:hypothetical protein
MSAPMSRSGEHALHRNAVARGLSRAANGGAANEQQPRLAAIAGATPNESAAQVMIHELRALGAIDRSASAAKSHAAP